MYGLDDNVDLTFLTGRRLDQVCLGEYQVQLNFEAPVSLSVAGEFTLDGIRYGASSGYVLHSVMGLSVNEASRVGRGDLMLRFTGHEVILHESTEPYESYTIRNGSQLIVV